MFPRCARGLYHLIEIWGDELAKIGDFQKQIEFGLAFSITYTNCGCDVDENGYFAYVNRILHWTAGGDVEKLGQFSKKEKSFIW